MMNKDIILLVDDLNIISKAKEVGITTFLFPVKNYTVGYPKTFLLEEIKERAFLLINRNLTNSDIDNLKELLNNLPDNIVGIVFEDLGIIEIVTNLKIEKVYNAKHLNCSTPSINSMLKYVDSVILSTDLTYDEIKNILMYTNNKASVYAFGLNQIFYSRRTLLSNYAKEYKLDISNELIVDEAISNQNFKVIENEFGTVFYPNKFYDGLRLFNEEGIKYFFINLAFLDIDNQKLLLDNITHNNYSLDNLDIPSSSFNLDRTTYFKLPPKDGDKK